MLSSVQQVIFSRNSPCSEQLAVQWGTGADFLSWHIAIREKSELQISETGMNQRETNPNIKCSHESYLLARVINNERHIFTIWRGKYAQYKFFLVSHFDQGGTVLHLLKEKNVLWTHNVCKRISLRILYLH